MLDMIKIKDKTFVTMMALLCSLLISVPCTEKEFSINISSIAVEVMNVLKLGVRTGSENGTAVLTGFSIKTAVKTGFYGF